MAFDASSVRWEFPILAKKIGSFDLAYLDNAATTQKPKSVIAAMDEFFLALNANVNRGVHPLAEESTAAYDKARKTVQTFINAQHSHEVIFTRNCTESINLVARSFGDTLKPGDTIALTMMEHHSNVIPWMQLALRRGIKIVWIPVDANGQPDLGVLREALKSQEVRLVAITALSNVFGSSPLLHEIMDMAHEYGAKVLVDAAQAAAHGTIDVQSLECDFLAFSGHKMYGPTGIGVLYGRSEILSNMPPFLGGGDMIQNVTTEGFTAAELPRKFEAGTPAIAEAIGLAAAMDWIESIGRKEIQKHESLLLKYACEKLSSIKGLTILGSKDPAHRASVVSFVADGVHPHDLTDVCGKEGVCMRSGHHCTQPLHRSLGINASARLSVAAYNTPEEIDRAVETIRRGITLLKK